jgi:hypothetical protein
MKSGSRFVFALSLASAALLASIVAIGGAAAQSPSAPGCERHPPPSQCKLPAPPAPTKSELDR